MIAPARPRGSADPFAEHDRLVAELTSRHDEARASFAALVADVTSPPVVYAHAEQFFLLPLFVPRALWTALRAQNERLLALTAAVVDDLLDDPARAAQTLGIDAGDAALAHSVPRRRSLAFARPDFLVAGAGAAFLETNVDSSLGGLGTADPLNRRYDALPLLRALRERMRLAWEPVMPPVADLFRAASGLERPAVAIVDWDDEVGGVPWPYERMRDDLARLGVAAEVGSDRELAFEAGRLTLRARPVDVVYRGFTPGARTRRGAHALEPLLRADRAGVPVLSDWWAPFYSSKVVLALLSAREAEGRLAGADAAFVRAHVPFSRVLREGFAHAGGRRVDLVPYVLRRREELVIKSASDGSAENVTVGCETDEAAWRAAVERALRAGGFIVQRFVEPPLVRQPVLTESGVELAAFRWNLSTFLIGGAAAGSCFRGLPLDAHLRISCMLGAREGTVFLTG
ncbi:MAG TPA: hypothetical protein VE826_12750 [Dongiaceae bacterium]|nr:hypothetical protein [Dongiaceae bacterium]